MIVFHTNPKSTVELSNIQNPKSFKPSGRAIRFPFNIEKVLQWFYRRKAEKQRAKEIKNFFDAICPESDLKK